MNVVCFLRENGMNSRGKNINPLFKLGKPEKIIKTLNF